MRVAFVLQPTQSSRNKFEQTCKRTIELRKKTNKHRTRPARALICAACSCTHGSIQLCPPPSAHPRRLDVEFLPLMRCTNMSSFSKPSRINEDLLYGDEQRQITHFFYRLCQPAEFALTRHSLSQSNLFHCALHPSTPKHHAMSPASRYNPHVVKQIQREARSNGVNLPFARLCP